MNAVKSGRNKRCSKQTTAFCRTGNAITASHWLSRSVVLSCSVLISVPVYHAGLLFYSTTDAQVPPKRQSLPGQATRPYMPEDGKKVKCTLVQALRLCTGRTVHRGSRGIALLFHDIGTRRGWGVSVTPRPLFTPGKDPVAIVQEAGWVPGPVWTGAENLALTGIRSPDRPARSQSLYRLSYPALTRRRSVLFYHLSPWHRQIKGTGNECGRK